MGLQENKYWINYATLWAINGELLILSHASQDTVLFQEKCWWITLLTPHNPFQALWHQGHNFKLVQTLSWQAGPCRSHSNTFLVGMTPWSVGSVKGGGQTPRESWYFIKVTHLADFALKSLGFSFLHPCYPVLLIFVCLSLHPVHLVLLYMI